MGRLCILIADRDVDAADALGTLCEAAGHEVDFAYDAASAVDAGRRLKPDVIFIDAGLADAGRELRAERALASTLVVEEPLDATAVLRVLEKRSTGS